MLNILDLEDYSSKKLGKSIRFEESVPYDKEEILDFLESIQLAEEIESKLIFNEYLGHIANDSVDDSTIILVTSDYNDDEDQSYIPIVLVIIDVDGNLIDSL